MPTNLTSYRVFIASPGGLEDVRERFRAVIEKYNAEDALRRKVVFIPVGWELTLGGMGRPQALINKDIEECDAFFLVLHDRWGSNPGAPEGYTSGTEEEYHKALEFQAASTKPLRDIVVFFKVVPPNRLSDPGPQLKAVLDFKRGLEEERKLLFHQFDDSQDFENRLRMVLASWVRRHEEEEAEQQGKISATSEGAAVIGTLPIAGAEHHEEAGFKGVEGAMEAQPQLADDPSPHALDKADSPVGRAAALAAAGRLTEAETLYAELTAANSDPAAATQYGEFLSRLGRKIQAAESFGSAIRIAEAGASDEWLARAEAGLGRLLASKGEYDQGEASLVHAADLYNARGAYVDLARVRLWLGEMNRNRDRLEAAREAYAAALDALRQEPDIEVEADVRAAFGQLNRDLGDLDAAAREYEQAIYLKQKIGSKSDLADMYTGHGAILEDRGDFEGARTAYKRSLELFEEAGNYAGIADASDHLGHIYEALGENAAAEAAFDRSAGVFETLQNFDGAADAYTSLAKIQTQRDKREQAAASYRQALALVGRLKNKEGVAEIYERLEQLIQAEASEAKPAT
jgi:tetratricopeptide (TPR) repeat protein